MAPFTNWFEAVTFLELGVGMMRRPKRFSMLLALMAGLACDGIPEPNENSGRDQQRAGAQTVPLDVVVTDAVNHAGGDSTDWKVFEIENTGQYTIELFWDNPYIECEVNLHDQYGTLLETVGHRSGGSENILVVDLSEVGLYYLRVHAEKERTTYSVRVYEGGPRQGDGTPGPEPVPEFDRPI